MRAEIVPFPRKLGLNEPIAASFTTSVILPCRLGYPAQRATPPKLKRLRRRRYAIPEEGYWEGEGAHRCLTLAALIYNGILLGDIQYNSTNVLIRKIAWTYHILVQCLMPDADSCYEGLK